MSHPVGSEAPAEGAGAPGRKDKRKALKKLKRKQVRREAAIREREEEEARANDPEEQLRIRAREQEEAEAAERERREFEERERIWLEAAARRAEVEAAAAAERAEEEARQHKVGPANESGEDDGWEYVEEGPAEIIWKGNEIIVKKKRVRVEKNSAGHHPIKEDDDRPTSNPLPPQSAAFFSYKSAQCLSAKEVLESVAQQIPNFGTEQDKAHCPFHLKTGACRFGSSCSRLHFYPDKSCTLLIKNMYNGPGLAWEQDEGLEYTDEEVERCYEEFYEDVHTEFLKFGELLNFKVCKNGSHHLRGNVYVHYKSLDSAIFASNAMNGRFFAGKQILCEFVGVYRWKVAICGEYMKSKLRTCSRGSACNFIHCFHNPGGDYEWADWDNPPPRYWIKKMAALFGPSVEAEYKEQMKLEQYERPRDSSRKRTPASNRYRSRRSSYGEIDTNTSGNGREDSDEKKKGCSSRSPRREHSNKTRKRIVSRDRQELHKEKYKTNIRGYGKEYCSRVHSSDEDSSKEKHMFFLKNNGYYEDNDSLEDHQRYTKRFKTEDLSRPEKAVSSENEQGKSRNKYKTNFHEDHGRKHRSSDRISYNINDNRDCSNEPSSDKYGIYVQDRYEGTYNADLGFDQDSHEDMSFHSKNPNERREDQYKLQPYRNHISRDHEQGSKKGRVCEKDSSDHIFSSDESSDEWKTTMGDLDYEETRYRSASNGSRRSSGKPSINSRERKHHREKECNQTEERYSSSDSEFLESSRRVYKKHSRSQTPTHSSRSSRRWRGHNSNRS